MWPVFFCSNLALTPPLDALFLPVPLAARTIARMPTEPLEIERVFGIGSQGVLRLKGPLTAENLVDFQNAMRRESAPTMILDLSDVPYIDSAGLGSLVGAYISGHKSGRRIALTGVNERVLHLFEITRVEQLFLIFPNLWDAIEALSSSGHA